MSRKRSLFEIHSAVFLFGLAGLFGKWITLSSIIIVLGRVFFASITLIIILFLLKQNLKIPKRNDYFLLSILGFILSVHWITFFQSIKVSTVAIGLLSFSSFPVFTTFIEPFFFKEKFEKINILMAFLVLTGVFLIIPRFEIANKTTQGVLWGLTSGLTFAFLSILNRKLSKQYSSLVIAFYQDSFATFLLLPFFFVLKPAVDLRNLLLLIILGVLCTAISHSLFIKGMRYIKAQTASIIDSLEPVYGIILAILFLREIPTIRTILGGIIILGTTIFVTLKAKSS
ncbi:MAG: DMT family transporter [Candidatus Aminicenantia bacterium]